MEKQKIWKEKIMGMLRNDGQEFYKKDNRRMGLRCKFHGETMTRKDAQDECNVNKIIEKFVRTGNLTHVTSFNGQYGDFSQITDYAGALNQIIEMEDQFRNLPSKVRNRFKNDPQALLSFLDDDKNYDEAIELGLIEKDKALAYQVKKQKAKEKAEQNARSSQAPASDEAEKKEKSKD